MIVGGYLLHLYCAAECDRQRERVSAHVVGGCGPGVGEFAADNERAARAEARRFGWIFRHGDAWCSRACLPTPTTRPAAEE